MKPLFRLSWLGLALCGALAIGRASGGSTGGGHPAGDPPPVDICKIVHCIAV